MSPTTYQPSTKNKAINCFSLASTRQTFFFQTYENFKADEVPNMEVLLSLPLICRVPRCIRDHHPDGCDHPCDVVSGRRLSVGRWCPERDLLMSLGLFEESCEAIAVCCSERVANSSPKGASNVSKINVGLMSASVTHQ